MSDCLARLLFRCRQWRHSLSQGLSFKGRCVLAAGCRLRIDEGGSITLGQGVHLEERVLLQAHGQIEIGGGVFANRDVMIVAFERIEIGTDTRIGERVSIRDHDHRFDKPELPLKDQGYSVQPVRIGQNCWIGCNSVVLKGVTIGDHAVVGAGSVVTRDVPAWAVVAGVPARVIKMRVQTALCRACC